MRPIFISFRKLLSTRNLFSLLLITTLGLNSGSASVIHSTGNGDWNNASTWLRNGNPSLPACGDTIHVQPNDIVTVNSQENYTGCASPLSIYVKGTLQFTNGNKLNLGCGSFVSVMSGGIIKKATSGGGNSTLISICGVTFWNASLGPLTGPVYLPVSLLNFNVTQTNEAVRFNWATASEENNDYFLVQRSTDASGYTDVAKVKGAGNSNVVNYYSGVDNKPSAGLNYYRLCQIDFNGAGYCYEPRAVLIKKKNELIVFPNPAKNAFISLVFEAEGAGLFSFKVRNINGALVFKKEDMLSEPGYNVLDINKYYHFEPGIYFVSIEIEHTVYHQKIVVTE